MHPERDLDADELELVPFGRNRLAHVLGASLFGAVTAALARSAPAQASHLPSPTGCAGSFRRCHNCFGESCVSSGCTTYGSACPGTGHCWNNCSGGLLYRCCDWREVVSGGTRACTCGSGSLGLC
jgi:hypothetical protein